MKSSVAPPFHIAAPKPNWTSSSCELQILDLAMAHRSETFMHAPLHWDWNPVQPKQGQSCVSITSISLLASGEPIDFTLGNDGARLMLADSDDCGQAFRLKAATCSDEGDRAPLPAR
jgi:hypothetical protein